MKTTIIIIILISMLLIFDFMTISFFDNELEYYDNQINTVIYYLENQEYNAAKNEIDALEYHWRQKRVMWNMLCDHNESEEISKLLSTSLTSIKYQQYYFCVDSLENLNQTISFAGDRYSLLIDNIS